MNYELTLFKRHNAEVTPDSWPGVDPFEQFDRFGQFEQSGFLVRGHVGVRGDQFGTHLDIKFYAFDSITAEFFDQKKFLTKQKTLQIRFPPHTSILHRIDILTPYAYRKANESDMYAGFDRVNLFPGGYIVAIESNPKVNETEDVIVLHRPSPEDGVHYTPYNTKRLMDMARLCEEDEVVPIIKYMLKLADPYMANWKNQ